MNTAELINVLARFCGKRDLPSLTLILDQLCAWGESHVAYLQNQGQSVQLRS